MWWKLDRPCLSLRAVVEQEVTLHCYDLSRGMAKQFSAMIIGKTIEAIWVR